MVVMCIWEVFCEVMRVCVCVCVCMCECVFEIVMECVDVMVMRSGVL